MKFEAIRAISWSVQDPDTSRAAFTEWLGLEPVAAGHVSPAQAARWGAPDMAGARFCAVASPDRPRVLMRFIERGPVAPVMPLMTRGWNAAELHVRDLDALAARLETSAFRIIGPPRDLLDNGAVRAMQVIGPGDELLYLTEMNHSGMARRYGRARAAVGRPFIVVLGVGDQPRTLDHYEALARSTTDPRPFRITVLARAHGLDPETTEFSIASLVMAQRFRIETDAYPPSAAARPQVPGHLPAGLCLVTISLSGALPGFRAGVLPGAPGGSLRVGPDGELMECLAAGGDEEARLLRDGLLA